MSRIPKLVAAGALFAGASGVTALAQAAPRGDAPVPATIVATVEFACTDTEITATWTLTVTDGGDGVDSDLIESVASPESQEVAFEPDNDLVEGDTAVGTSTHPADTEAVALTVDYETTVVGGPELQGSLTAEEPVVCPAPPPEEPEEPAEPAEPVPGAVAFAG